MIIEAIQNCERLVMSDDDIAKGGLNREDYGRGWLPAVGGPVPNLSAPVPRDWYDNGHAYWNSLSHPYYHEHGFVEDWTYQQGPHMPYHSAAYHVEHHRDHPPRPIHPTSYSSMQVYQPTNCDSFETGDFSHIDDLRPIHGLTRVQTSGSADASDPVSSVSTTTSQTKYRKRPREGKRFTWTEELHGEFVNAIFMAGLKHASPEELASLIPLSQDDVAKSIASIEIARQKYCNKGILLRQCVGFMRDNNSATKKTRLNKSNETNQTQAITKTSEEMESNASNCFLSLPSLTSEEESSPLGVSILNLVVLLKTLEQKLRDHRVAVMHHTNFEGIGDAGDK